MKYSAYALNQLGIKDKTISSKHIKSLSLKKTLTQYRCHLSLKHLNPLTNISKYEVSKNTLNRY